MSQPTAGPRSWKQPHEQAEETELYPTDDLLAGLYGLYPLLQLRFRQGEENYFALTADEPEYAPAPKHSGTERHSRR